jgi:pyruvate kinase
MLDIAVEESLNSGIVKHGDLVVITAGVPVGEAGTTNLMKIHVVGDILTRAQGIGRRSAFGKVVIAHDAKEALEKVKPGSILVTLGSDRDMVPAIEKCAALITQEGGLTSHAAVVGLNLSIPVIVGVDCALELFTEGQEITVDASRGIIYNGHASVL